MLCRWLFESLLLSTFFLISIYCDWVRIDQRIPNEAYEHRVSFDNSLKNSDIFLDKNPDNLKYEDILDLFGPEVESDFLKFLKVYNNESNKTINTDKNVEKINKKYFQNDIMNKSKEFEQFRKDGDNEKNITTKNSFHDDPWAIYDKPAKVVEETSDSDENPNVQKFNNQTDFIETVFNFTIDSKRNLSTKESELESAKNLSDKVHLKLEVRNNNNTKYNMTRNKPVPEKRIVYKLIEVEPPEPFSFKKIVEFLKNIQESFAFNTARGITDKIKYLQDFKNKMLDNIESRLNTIWPSFRTENHRKRRDIFEHQGGGGNGMDFPSSEAALMTISFLTFAVFLIKLVLQVIHTIKSKHYSFNTFGTMTSGQTANQSPIKIIKRNRNARRLSTSLNDLENIEKTLRSLEQKP